MAIPSEPDRPTVAQSPPGVNSPLLDAALLCQSLGWNLVPQCIPLASGGCRQHGPRCENPGKVPLLKLEVLRANPAGPDKLRLWFDSEQGLYRGCNLGAQTGIPSHVVVLDADGPEGIEALGTLTQGRGFGLVDYAMSQTPGAGKPGPGNHLYFYTDRAIPSMTLLPKVEVKGDGGMVTLPPSRGANGHPYIWLIDPGLALEGHTPRQLPSLPAWLLEMIFQKRQARESFTLPQTIGEGERNLTLFQLASSLRSKGFTPEEILATLEAANARCVPPKPHSELVTIAKSAGRYPMGSTAVGMPTRAKRDISQMVKGDDIEW